MATWNTTIPHRNLTSSSILQIRKNRIGPTDVSLGILFFWSSIPESITGDIYILNIPLRFVLFYFAAFCCLASAIATKSGRVSNYLLLSIAACIAMGLNGILRGNETKFWVIDFANYTGLMFGIYWGINRSVRDIVSVLQWWASGVSLLLILNLLGLVFGFLEQVNEGDRLYSYSLFVSSAFVSSIFPFWYLTSNSSDSKSFLNRNSRKFALIAISTVVVASMLSATRSMFLTAVISILIVMWYQLKGKHTAIWMLLTASASITIALVAFESEQWRNTYLAERLLSTEVREEIRFLELEMMFEQMEGQMLIGSGFGSRFESCIVLDGLSLSYAPHIAILTLLYKGGVITFLLWIIIPFVKAVGTLFQPNCNKLCRLSSAGVLVYCVQASMSGGWNMISLFLFGAMFSIASRASVSIRSVPSDQSFRQRAVT